MHFQSLDHAEGTGHLLLQIANYRVSFALGFIDVDFVGFGQANHNSWLLRHKSYVHKLSFYLATRIRKLVVCQLENLDFLFAEQEN